MCLVVTSIRRKETIFAINSSMYNLIPALTAVSVRQIYSIENAGRRTEKLPNINKESIIITVHTGVWI